MTVPSGVPLGAFSFPDSVRTSFPTHGDIPPPGYGNAGWSPNKDDFPPIAGISEDPGRGCLLKASRLDTAVPGSVTKRIPAPFPSQKPEWTFTSIRTYTPCGTPRIGPLRRSHVLSRTRRQRSSGGNTYETNLSEGWKFYDYPIRHNALSS